MGSHIIKTDPTTIKYMMDMSAYTWTRPFFVAAYQFDSVLDIGAHIGTESICARLTNPKSHIVAIEPSDKAFEILNSAVVGLNIETHKIILGDGSDLVMRNASANVRNSAVKAKHLDSEACPSMTLSDMIVQYNITGRYCIKMNCEGGERYVFEHEPSLMAIAKSEMTLIACHGNELKSIFDGLCKTYFSKTHDMILISGRRKHFNCVMVSKKLSHLSKSMVL
jgi:FkbM family methyltransferase